ncbi:MAG: undecaprenyl/decaprenyl-phosphate alpha-N-acetylglucosaminyl 1-phosphate transferase [Lentisphaeria bacterium]|nr:undecaprenyl/decaprenyl-phosphate alpha-N-acetylglucosaminyl 1-phosphate transferase [Lentisphaeria bacterium]
MLNGFLAVCAVFFLISFISALLLTPFCMRLAHKTGFLDIPACEQHKQHKKATPLLGGLAMYLSFGITFLAGGILWLFFKKTPLSDSFQNITDGLILMKGQVLVLFLCITATMLLGLYDDKYSMKAWKKLLGQIAISLAVVLWGGASITAFFPWQWVSVPLTVFWFVLIFNAINFFDNMDGLAAGTAFIAFVFFMIAGIVNGQYLVSILSAAAAGSSLGFWKYNKNPAKLFMGDSGSHFLAFLIAYISTKVTYFTPGVSSTKLNILIPLFILTIPLLDTLTVVLIRLKNHKPIYVGDHNHISHRFWHMGLSRANAVNMVHLLSIIAGLGALPLLRGDLFTSVLLVVQGLVLYLMICFLQYAVKVEK